MAQPPPGPWPAVSIADTRGILRREPLTPPLARAIRETLAARRRVFLVVSRLTSSLACDECGTVVRCAECAIALAYSRAAARLVCRLCAAAHPLPDTCSACHGRRLSPFGWGAERVEHAVRRRFPEARIARWDPDAARGARGEAQRAAAADADVVIGTRGALRLFGPASLGLAGFVAPDQLLRAPDFRAGERTLGLVWAAAERIAPDGALIIQSQNPGHYAFAAVARQNLDEFYRHELKFRAELGYPPFRRLAVVAARASDATETRRLADAVGAALRGHAGLTVYPPVAEPRDRARRIVVKGGAELPRRRWRRRCGTSGRRARRAAVSLTWRWIRSNGSPESSPQYGDPALRRRAAPVGEVTPEVRRLIADMIETMYDEVGIGLAAPQVGVSLRLIVVADEEGRGVQALVNPIDRRAGRRGDGRGGLPLDPRRLRPGRPRGSG